MEKKTYDREFKAEAVRLVVDQGVRAKQAATELGISESALRKWIKEHQGPGVGGIKLSPDGQKIRDLEKKVRVLEMERDILKKATAFFAKESR
jgi:transposase